jgi:hypothetical protein
MKMTDLMVSEGYLSSGYNIISLDDCWLSHNQEVLEVASNEAKMK